MKRRIISRQKRKGNGALRRRSKRKWGNVTTNINSASKAKGKCRAQVKEGEDHCQWDMGTSDRRESLSVGYGKQVLGKDHVSGILATSYGGKGLCHWDILDNWNGERIKSAVYRENSLWHYVNTKITFFSKLLKNTNISFSILLKNAKTQFYIFLLFSMFAK